jgi:phytoene synthase
MKIPSLRDIGERSVLGIASLFFDARRRRIFKICYGIMRESDDIVDERRALRRPILKEERRELQARIDETLMYGTREGPKARSFHDLLEAHSIPDWPFDAWRRALRYDLGMRYFPSHRSFLNYAEGAAVAPGALFMHLCGMRKGPDAWLPPPFDLREHAAPLALFCYHVHIVRDLKEDVANGIFFFPQDLMAAMGLEYPELEELLGGGRFPKPLRDIVAWYHARAGRYRDLSRKRLSEIARFLPARYRASCELILALYGEMHDSITIAEGNFLERDIRPSLATMRHLVSAYATGVEAGS